MKITRNMIFGLLFLALLILPAGSVWAMTAANTQIVNNATLTFNDGTGTKSVSASVTVKISLVQSGVIITPPSNQTTPYTAANTTLTDTFTVTSTANGPDTYTFTPGLVSSNNTTAPSVGAATVISLGATVTTSGSTTTVQNVPSDGVSDGKVNGIALNATVVITIAGTPYTRTVTAVTDPVSGTATITLSAPLPSAPPPGTGIYEQRSVAVTVQSGTIQTAGSDVTVTVNAAVTNGSTTVTSTSVVNTYTSGTATLKKYVRNVSDGTIVGGNPLSVTVNGASHTYYDSNVTAKPGDVLEYVLVAANSGTGGVTAAAITDVMPTDFVAFKSGAYGGAGQDIVYINDSGSESKLTAAADGDTATVAGSNLTVYVGTSATNVAGGTIAAGKNVKVAYQVTINP